MHLIWALLGFCCVLISSLQVLESLYSSWKLSLKVIVVDFKRTKMFLARYQDARKIEITLFHNNTDWTKIKSTDNRLIAKQ